MSELNVVILDYGSGNVASVLSMMQRLTDKVHVSNKITDIECASHFILPGVGSYSEAMKKVQASLPFDLLEQRVLKEEIPFLGICVGMQLLFSGSEEFGFHKGFNWIPGSVIKIKGGRGLPVPHIGWNALNNNLDNGYIEQGSDMYFVHSYKAVPEDRNCILSTVQYGEEICALVQSGNILGAQFHPEKSQAGGIKLLSQFLGRAC